MSLMFLVKTVLYGTLLHSNMLKALELSSKVKVSGQMLQRLSIFNTSHVHVQKRSRRDNLPRRTDADVETTTDTQTHGHTQGRSTHASYEITQNKIRLTQIQSTSVDGKSWVST